MRILVVDDEEAMRHMLSVMLTKEGFDVSSVEDGEAALKVLAGEEFDFVLSDIKMPGLDGPGLLREFEKRGHRSTVIMMSAYGTVDVALECMKLGAYDYISKPFKADEIILTIRKAQERERLKRENKRLLVEGGKDTIDGVIYTNDPVMKGVIKLVKKVADYDTTVLITGETGTGKELIARGIHNSGGRADGPFVAVNCGAIPHGLLESELFGHVRGAFTDAVKTRDGLFHEADGGTIFLDEVGEMPFELQVKLLRVLQEGEVRRVGDTKSRRVDVRVVAATIKDLEAESREGAFREDLFYRLNVIPIVLPPLRERKDDIEGLAGIFIDRCAGKFSKAVSGLSGEAAEALISYNWPGNVRELENVIERAVILEEGDEVSASVLPIRSASATTNGASIELPDTLSIKKSEVALEKELIKRALKKTGGNRTRSAELLEISHRALLYKIKGFGL
jgi:two-component system response regulator AtoC